MSREAASRCAPRPLVLVLLASLAGGGAAAASLDHGPILQAVEELCAGREGFGEQGCGVKVDVELTIDGSRQATFLVLRLHRKADDAVLGLDRLWIQAFRNGSLIDFGLDGFRFAGAIEPTPFHGTGRVATAAGPVPGPLPEEDHYLGPLRAVGAGATRVGTVLLRASHEEDEPAWRALYDLFLGAVGEALSRGGELELLEPGRSYCWNEDGSTTECE